MIFFPNTPSSARGRKRGWVVQNSAILPVQRDPVQRDLIQRDSVQRDSIQRGLVQSDPAQRDPVHRDLVRRDPARKDPAQRDPLQVASEAGSATSTQVQLEPSVPLLEVHAKSRIE